jgi:excisionase family DNA binding protein
MIALEGEGGDYMHQLLKPEEVAARLRVERRTVIAWLQSGRLEGIKLGNRWRITPEAADRLIKVGGRTWEKK